jgi:hypothetical protein
MISCRVPPPNDFLEGSVERAADAENIIFRHMGVDHRRLKILMAQQFLDGPDIISGFQKMCIACFLLFNFFSLA